jgi:hypothetical protein
VDTSGTNNNNNNAKKRAMFGTHMLATLFGELYGGFRPLDPCSRFLHRDLPKLTRHQSCSALLGKLSAPIRPTTIWMLLVMLTMDKLEAYYRVDFVVEVCILPVR